MKRIGIFTICLSLSMIVLAQTTKETPSNWPKQINTTNGKILVYQPQPDSLIGIKLFGRAAVSYTKNGGQPTFGAIWFMTTIAVDRNSREVSMSNVKILNVRFPNQDQDKDEKMQKFKTTLETEIPKWYLDMTMDELNASLADAKAVMKQEANLNNSPPEIIFATVPSVLVLFDGDPKFKPVPDSKILQAVNTPYFIVQDPGKKEFYLYGGTWWYKTNDAVRGKWVNIKEPPADIRRLQENLAAQVSKDNDQQTAQGDDKTKDKSQPSSPPQIIVRTTPTELVQSNGQPDFAPIQGTQLLYMTNSENNIFMYIDKQMYYILISGRWYTSAAMAGPWSFIASDKLPADFANIPEGSDKDQVLASVAGTNAANEAVLDAQIPQTAAVDRKTATCNVTYDGDPKFVQIKGTLLYRAANTSSTVIMADKSYYVCDNAVWFVGDSPVGPWFVATEIPSDFQNIPPEDPVYNVKYVYIYESTPDVVYVGYLPGYTGCYVYGPTVVYGTGFYYNPWYGPYYYPRPVTYGFAMSYNPWTGWGFGWGMSVGFMSVGFYGPHMGGWWGPPMFHPPFCPPYNHYYGPRPPVYRNTSVHVNVNNNYYNRNNVYNNHQSGVRPGSGTNPRPGTTPADRGRPSTQPSGRPSQGQPADRGKPSAQPGTQPANRAGTAPNTRNNVYTDKSGNVYRKDQNNWQKNDGKTWQNVDQGSGRPSGQPSSQPGRQDPTVRPGGQPSTQPGRQEPSARPGGQPTQQPSARPSGQPSQPPANRQGGGNPGFDRNSMERQSQSRDRGQQMNQNAGSFQRNSGGYHPPSGGGGHPSGGGGRR
ncbi:MAG: carbohydrate-binding family V/XII [Bacteroidetes bacterium]|nr:carbohydrate-binding family V/XII [Bacteroidota bacterium]